MESSYDENTFVIETGFVRFIFTRGRDGEMEIKSERKTDYRFNSVYVPRAVSHRLMRWLDGDV